MRGREGHETHLRTLTGQLVRVSDIQESSGVVGHRRSGELSSCPELPGFGTIDIRVRVLSPFAAECLTFPTSAAK